MIEILARGVPVALGARVTSVRKRRRGGGGVELGVRSGEAGAETKLTAEFAVVTVSLGVLQQGSLTFDPPLSAQQQQDGAAEEAEEPPEPTVGNPLQVLAEQNGLQLKVERAVPQAYSNGWRGHAAWYVNGSKPPSMAIPGHTYKDGGEWKGPDKIFQLDHQVDMAMLRAAREQAPPCSVSALEVRS